MQDSGHKISDRWTGSSHFPNISHSKAIVIIFAIFVHNPLLLFTWFFLVNNFLFLFSVILRSDIWEIIDLMYNYIFYTLKWIHNYWKFKTLILGTTMACLPPLENADVIQLQLWKLRPREVKWISEVTWEMLEKPEIEEFRSPSN